MEVLKDIKSRKQPESRPESRPESNGKQPESRPESNVKQPENLVGLTQILCASGDESSVSRRESSQYGINTVDNTFAP